MGNAHPIDGRPQSEVQVIHVKLEVVASFCYLGGVYFIKFTIILFHKI